MIYRTEKYGTHEKLEAGLNKLAVDGWEPVVYAVHSDTGFGTSTVHFVILRKAGREAGRRQ